MKSYKTQFEEMGFRYDELSGTGYKSINGVAYTVMLMPAKEQLVLTAYCVIHNSEMQTHMKNALAQYADNHRNIAMQTEFDGSKIVIVQKMEMMSQLIGMITDNINAVNYYISQFGGVPCCARCGRAQETALYIVRTGIVPLCLSCARETEVELSKSAVHEAVTTPKYGPGILGAVLGGLIGAAVWVACSMMGYIGYFAGAFGAAAAYGLYKKFSGKMTLAGLLISLITSLLLLAGSMFLAASIDVYNELQVYGNYSMAEAMQMLPLLLEDGEYMGTLVYNNIWGLVVYLASAGVIAAMFHTEGQTRNRFVRLT